MGYRASISFIPLIGHRVYIDYFKTEVAKKYKPNKYGYFYGITPEENGEYYYEQTNGSPEEMCKEISTKYPGITFYGYAIIDSTTGTYSAYQILWNKKDGIFFIGSPYHYNDCWNEDIIYDGVSVRAETYDGEDVHLYPEHLGYNHINCSDEEE